MKETWRLAYRNLLRNKRRNFATGAAIAIGFAALLALGGYIHRVENFLRVHSIYVRQSGHIVIYQKDGLDNFSHKPKEYSLSPHALQQITKVLNEMPNVDLYGAQLVGNGLIGNGCKSLPFIATGMDPMIDKKLREHPLMKEWTPQFISYRRGFGLWEYANDFGAIALSEGLAKLLGKTHVVSDFNGSKEQLVVADCQSPNVKEQIAADANVQLVSGSWSGSMSALDGEIVAHYSTGMTETNNSSLFTSLSHLQKLYDTDHVTFYSVWLKDEQKLSETVKFLADSLEEKNLLVDIYQWNDERINPMYTGTMDFLYTMISFLASILGVIVIFSIFNATTITVMERAQEIGMMRSLGFTKLAIRTHFLREVVLLALISVGVGGVIGFCAIWFINSVKVTFYPPGVAGGMILMLVPNSTFVVFAALSVFSLAIFTTFIAIRKVTHRTIPTLLSGVHR